MPIKRASFIIKGMSQDLAESKFNPQFAFENKNLRITASKDSNTYVLTTERGNLELTPSGDVALFGSPLGQCVIDNKLILFTHSSSGDDGIFKLWFDGNTLKSKLLYSGDLNFNSEHPIETLAVYESDSVKKVYWTDGFNQPRFINIDGDSSSWNDTSFDFIPNLYFWEEVTIEKQYSSSAVFAPGVIQYFFTYYNRFGQESNIFYSSPLYYITDSNKGAAPDKTVSNAFKISIPKYDPRFDYVRVYSILRTSIDAVPEARKVVDLPIGTAYKNVEKYISGNTYHQNDLVYFEGNIYRCLSTTTVDPDDYTYWSFVPRVALTYTDIGNGEVIDPYRLLYVGGEVITAETFTQKDNTLFLGNLKKESVKANVFWVPLINQDYSEIPYNANAEIPYDYTFELDNSSNEIKGFTCGETYRLGFQLQNKNGQWSTVVWIKDEPCTNHFQIENNTLRIPKFYATFDLGIVSNFVQNGYRKIRPVVCFPSDNERTILCQGVVNPTVYNVKDRYENTPYTQASWFFRPVYPRDISYSAILPHRHNKPLSDNKSTYGEIQCLEDVASYPYTTDINNFVPDYKAGYFVDESVVTLNSPDIEFGKIDIQSGDNVKFRVTGVIPITGYRAKYDIQTSTAPLAYNGNVALGFVPYTHNSVWRGALATGRPWDTIVNKALWCDYIVDQTNPSSIPGSGTTFYRIYPWHKNGALNNYPDSSSSSAPANLLKKRLIHYRYSPYTTYLDAIDLSDSGSTVNISSVNVDVTDIATFNSNEVIPLRLKSQLNNSNQINYLGNVNTAVIHSSTYHIYSSNNSSASNFFSCGDADAPIQIKYKSSPHAIIAFNINQQNSWTLPRFVKDDDDQSSQSSAIQEIIRTEIADNSTRYFWDPDKTLTGYKYKRLNNAYPLRGYLWLGELYRDSEPTFGGDTPEALLNNKWEVAGKALDLYDGTSITIDWTEGDTYYQRYDCLKTCPLSPEDKNGIVDILSFMCETRVNIDGRYDNNRGVLNTEITSENFNLINPVYSQRNNFFTYRVADEHRDTINKYPNVITWSGVKTYGEEVDAWANVTLTSTLELDGNKGEVTALRRFNDNIIAFQDTGISQILYNENVQIPVTNGVPIEISNSGRVQGKRYISNHIGCSNKWSICETSKGLYFIDSNLKDFYLFNGQISNLSESLGMHTWICNNVPNGKWSPRNYSEITQYDKTVGDVLITTENACLAFNEDINTFTSLYDYHNTYPIVTIKDKTLACPAETAQLYLQHAGNYNVFFGDEYPKPYWTTIIVNQEPTVDKIFNNVQFRGDCFNGDTYDYSKCPFDTLETSNEYQSGTLSLVNTKDKPSSLKKKFRTWYTLIPRDSSNHRDRMRNPWLKVTLSRQNDIGTDKTVIHDIAVDYFA